MGKLTTKGRKRVKSWGLPSQKKYPLTDRAHARNALARVAQHGSRAEQKKVRAAVHRRFPSIGR